MRVVKKLFFNPAWVVACRKIEINQPIIPNKKQNPFSVLLPTSKEWYADSFCFEDNGKCYLFVEIMGRNGSKGTLGVTEFKNGEFSEVIEVLRETFHLSYPNVFKYKNRYFMIPETNESNQLRLYESHDFPYKWELKKVLYEGANLVDSSIMKNNEKCCLIFSHDITSKPFLLRVFYLDLEKMVVKELNGFEKASYERPGGNIITVNGERFRVLQDCSEEYGKRLKLYKITKCDLNPALYSEEYYGEITIDLIPMNVNKRFDRVHTLTRSGNYEAIDSQYSRFYLSKPIKKIVEKIVK